MVGEHLLPHVIPTLCQGPLAGISVSIWMDPGYLQCGIHTFHVLLDAIHAGLAWGHQPSGSRHMAVLAIEFIP